MKHILPTETINKILAYLASKAFSEVSGLIQEIQTAAVQYLDPQDVPAKDLVKEVTPSAVE